MKIYTRTGDAGQTGLYGGRRVAKDHLRVSAYGTVDEANTAIGLARAALAGAKETRPNGTSDAAQHGAGLALLDADLAALQSLLFDLGADLATPPEAPQRRSIRAVDERDVAASERMIDRYEAELPPLRQFILPGGSAASAALQLGRAVIRRAEREAVALSRDEGVNEQALVLLNRLSDLLFVMARGANFYLGEAEVPWVARSPT